MLKKVLKTALVLCAVLTLVAGITYYRAQPSTRLVDASGGVLTTGDPSEEESEDDFAAARRAIDAGDFESARETLLGLLETAESDGRCCVLLSRTCRELEQYEEALDYGLKSIQLLPQDAEARYAYAKALADKMIHGESKLASMMLLPKWKAELQTSIELDPSNTEARAEQLAFFTYMPAMIGGDTDRALDLAAELEALVPAEAALWRIRIRSQRDETEQAISLCRGAARTFPENGMFPYTLGTILVEMEDFAGAEASFEEAKRIDHGEAYYRTLVAQGTMEVDNDSDCERALGLFDEYLTSHPDLPMMPPTAMVLLEKGRALESLGRLDEARAAFESCLAMEPRYTEASEALERLDP